MKLSFTILLFIYSGLSMAKPGDEDKRTIYAPVVTVVQYKLANRTIPIKIYRYGLGKDVVMIHLHSNEKSSVLAAMQWLKTNGGLLIRIENGDERNIAFEIDTASFQFDPNHIFSLAGIRHDFENNRHHVDKAIVETQKFSKKILSLIPPNPSLIVALHNNFNGGFGINDYLKGRERSGDAAKVYRNPSQDPDDIFLTTDANLYQQLSNEGFNTILQSIKTAKKDGSLSVYFHEKKVRYLNCETEHEKQSMYFQMLSKALSFIERRNMNEQLLAYSSTDSLGALKKGISIYKDSVYMGEIKSANRSADGTMVTGKFSLPLKMKALETIELETITIENGVPFFLKIKAMSGPVVKSEGQKLLLKIVPLIETRIEPLKEPVDSVSQN